MNRFALLWIDYHFSTIRQGHNEIIYTTEDLTFLNCILTVFVLGIVYKGVELFIWDVESVLFLDYLIFKLGQLIIQQF